jgi:hypothetical protein
LLSTKLFVEALITSPLIATILGHLGLLAPPIADGALEDVLVELVAERLIVLGGLELRGLRHRLYPPGLQDAAVQNVLQQAEALSAEWAA